jgi:predicted nucleotidyltransferase
VYKKIIVAFLKDKITNLEAVILFGSYAKNLADKNSDIDVAFLSKDKIFNLERWQLQEDLASKLNKNIDLINLETATDVLKFQIASQGKVIYAADRQNVENYLDKIYTAYLQLNEDRKGILEDISKGVYYERRSNH